MRWVGVVAVVLVAVAGTAVALYALQHRARGVPASGTRHATAARDAALLSEPRASGATLATLTAGAALLLLGRTEDNAWVYASPADRGDLAGWLPADAVRDGGNLATLARIDTGASGVARTAASGGTRSGPLPDLVLHNVGARQDRLFVLVANDGQADFGGKIMVTVNDGAPRRIDVGKPLRPGEALEAVLNDEYVQRRARVVVTVSSPDVTEASLDNNRLEVVVAPDQPIDLELESASVDAVTARLVLGVRNHGPIPLVGTLAVSVRESPPSNRLITDGEAILDVGAGGLQRIELGTPARVDLTRVTVGISTDAISDSNSTNDLYPR